MKILVTGAGGKVGTELCRELAKSHDLRRLDIQSIPTPGGEVLQGSVTKWETVKRAVDGMDAVAHLAIHHPGERRHQSYEQYIQDDVDTGVKGTDMLLHAAKEAGVKRFVYTPA